MNRPCPHCGETIEVWRNPAPTVDIVIVHPDRGVVLVQRGKEPFGFALPGGFVEYGESVETAAVRETLEETSLNVRLAGLLGVYSVPDRDPRRHTMSTVFLAETDNPDALKAGDDAAGAAFYPLSALPPLVFDHSRILRHVLDVLAGKRAVAPVTGEHD